MIGPGRSLRLISHVLVLSAGLVTCSGRRGSVVVGLPSPPTAPLPYGTVEEFTNSILSNVYEPLVELDADLGLKPGLAESWHTPDDHTWVFTLRHPVTLHDGRSLDAAMVAASICLARDDPSSKRRAEIAAVRDIEAPDARTLVLHTDRALGSLPCRLASIPVAVAAERKGAPPVGSGPYRIRHWLPTGDVVLEAFPSYRAGRPPLGELEFRVVPEVADRVERLQRGWMSTNGDAELTYEYLLHTPAKGLGVGNGGEYSDPALDRLLEDASARLGAPERAEALRAVAERVQEMLPVVPLYSQKELYALAAKLEFRPRLDRRIRGLDLGWKR